MTILALRDVTYTYPGGTRALNKINLEVRLGEFVALLGPNGCGKTTLLHHLNGLLKPDDGKVLLRGVPLAELPPAKIFSSVGLVFQDPNDQLFAPTVFEDVAFGPTNLDLSRSEVGERVQAALRQVGAWDLRQAPPHQLSFGQQKRVSIAGVLAMRPQVLLLDEPTAGLDPLGTSQLMHLLEELNSLGLTIVLATHDVDLVPAYASRVVVLEQGRISLQGSPREVFGDVMAVRQAGLRLPRVAHLFEVLKAREGWLVEGQPLTVGEARRALVDYRLYKGKLWRRGYTTGSCAAAAAKAAVIALREGKFPDQVEIELPAGKQAVLKIAATDPHPDGMACAVVKDGGDDPDVTHGLEIWAKAVWNEGGINVKGGRGVGTVTGPGLPVPVGYPAINPVPMSMIQKEVAGELPPGKGAEITIFVPGGEEAAARTLNPKLGIVGGISILGTSGIVEPMSEEAFKTSLAPQIKSALGLGFGTVVLTPGRMGEVNAEKRGLPGGAVVQMSNFVGFMLEECARLGVKGVILFGHIGKLIKVAAGIFHTHSRVADARLETLAAWAIKLGVPGEQARRVMEAKTVEEAVQGLLSSGYGNIFPELAAGASQRARDYVRGSMEIGTVLTSLPGEILGMDETAVRLGRGIGWKV